MSDAPLGMDFDTMNEADVREIIVRPLLHRLGYRHGTEANIRTEVSLRYGYAFWAERSLERTRSCAAAPTISAKLFPTADGWSR